MTPGGHCSPDTAAALPPSRPCRRELFSLTSAPGHLRCCTASAVLTDAVSLAETPARLPGAGSLQAACTASWRSCTPSPGVPAHPEGCWAVQGGGPHLLPVDLLFSAASPPWSAVPVPAMVAFGSRGCQLPGCRGGHGEAPRGTAGLVATLWVPASQARSEPSHVPRGFTREKLPKQSVKGGFAAQGVLQRGGVLAPHTASPSLQHPVRGTKKQAPLLLFIF